MSLQETLTALTLLVAGFTACAEFGSYAFVHPVIRRLPIEHHIAVEQGLVRTFGRFMPVAMPGSLLLIAVWIFTTSEAPIAWELLALCLWVGGVVTTILVNVRINVLTARWQDDGDAEQWRAMRGRWELFQAIRSWVFLASFGLLCALAAISA